jgi:hypothetical protein
MFDARRSSNNFSDVVVSHSILAGDINSLSQTSRSILSGDINSLSQASYFTSYNFFTPAFKSM